jgi:plastocyanin
MNDRVHRASAQRSGCLHSEKPETARVDRGNDVRVIVASVIVAFSLCAWGCGSSTDSGGNPVTPTPTPAPTPTPTPTPTSGVVTIDVVSENGAQSFSPNPATLPAGQTVVWRNIDRVTHRVVLNNGSLDTGNLAPGASSQPMSINATAGAYHCSIHPSMVGTIIQGGSTAQSPAN